MARNERLYEEMTIGPLAPKVAPWITLADDGQIATIFNREDIMVVGTLPVNVFAGWASSTGTRAKIQDISVKVDDPLRDSALTVLDLLQGNLQSAGIDMTNVDINSAFDKWEAAGIITAEERAELVTLSLTAISRAQQIDMPISNIDVRQEIWADDGTRLMY